MNSATLYKWRDKFRDIDAPKMTPTKRVEMGNTQLRRLQAEKQLRAVALIAAIGKN